MQAAGTGTRAELNTASAQLAGAQHSLLFLKDQGVDGQQSAPCSTTQQVWILPYHTEFSQESSPGFVCAERAMCRCWLLREWQGALERKRRRFAKCKGLFTLL